MKPTAPRILIGWDASEMVAWNVAATSLRMTAKHEVLAERLAMANLRARGLYWRPTGQRDHGYWDDISAAPMSTGHAIARFLVPHLCSYRGWALFTDGDVLFRRDVADLFALADPTKAVQVVQHQYAPTDAQKMEGHIQTRYARKNWSSVILWNCGHPAHQALTVDLVNTAPGRDLHRFCWLQDHEIGELAPEWNFLVGHSSPAIDPAIVHFTEGVPDMAGYEHIAYADEWYVMAKAAGYQLVRPAREAVA